MGRRSSKRLNVASAPPSREPSPPKDRCCIICCRSPSGVPVANNNEEESDDKDISTWLTGNFTKFCQQVASKTSSGMMEVAGIILTPQLLIQDPNSVRVCAGCRRDIDEMMDQKGKTKEVERQVLALQTELLSALRELEFQMGQYSEKMNKIENSVRTSDEAGLKRRLEENADSGLENSVMQLREGLVEISNDLRDYQDDLSMRVDCNSAGDAFCANPLDYALVKVEVDEEGEGVDENLLNQDDFYADGDLPDAPKQNKYTQTTGYFPLGEKGPSINPVGKPKKGRKDTMSKYRRARLERLKLQKTNPELFDPDADKPFICHLCKERFLSEFTLESHHVRKHGAPKLKCPKCDLELMNRHSLRCHLNRHDYDNLRVYECSLCPKIFTNSGHIGPHMLKEHKKSRTPTTSDSD